MSDQRGSLIDQQFGNYRIMRLLGQGGFADVYLGEHVHLGTQAAIKVLYARLGNDDREKFLVEARTIAHLAHPNIVQVLDFGVENGTPFLVMGYAARGSLRQIHRKEMRLDATLVVAYVRQVASALQYAHDRHLIHRDVKPENMLLGNNNSVLLSDFGIAQIAQSSRYQNTQEIAGTVAYMAPEQLQGRPEPASDQYSLGIVVYEWLAGARPFQGSLAEMTGQHMTRQPSSLRQQNPAVSPAIEQAVLKALAKNARDRFSTVESFANALNQAVAETTGQVTFPQQGASTPSTAFLPQATFPQQGAAASSAMFPPQATFPQQGASTPPGYIVSPAPLTSPSPLTGDWANQAQSQGFPPMPSGSGPNQQQFPPPAGGMQTPAQPWSPAATNTFTPQPVQPFPAAPGMYSPQPGPERPPVKRRSPLLAIAGILVLTAVLIAGSLWGITTFFHKPGAPLSPTTTTNSSAQFSPTAAATPSPVATTSSDQTPASDTTPVSTQASSVSLVTTSPALPYTIKCVQCSYPGLGVVLTEMTASPGDSTTLLFFTITNNGTSQCSNIGFYTLSLEDASGTQYKTSGQASDTWSLNAGTLAKESPTFALIPGFNIIYTLNVRLTGSCSSSLDNTYQTINLQFAQNATTGSGTAAPLTDVVPASPKLPLAIACVQCTYGGLSLKLTSITADSSGSTTLWSFTVTNKGASSCSGISFYGISLEDPQGTPEKTSGQANDSWSLNAGTSLKVSPTFAFIPQPGIIYVLNIRLTGSCPSLSLDNTYQTENMRF